MPFFYVDNVQTPSLCTYKQERCHRDRHISLLPIACATKSLFNNDISNTASRGMDAVSSTKTSSSDLIF